MKYLVILFFVGSCLGAGPKILEYHLKLEFCKDDFLANIDLILDTVDNKDALELNLDETVMRDTKCQYFEQHSSSPPPTTPPTTIQLVKKDCTLGTNRITFSGKRMTPVVSLSYRGNYTVSKLEIFRDGNNTFYFGRMNISKTCLLPLPKNDVQFRLEGTPTIFSNVEYLSEGDKNISLDDVIFVGGDIEKISSKQNEGIIDIYRMKNRNYKNMEKFEKLSRKLLDSLNKITGCSHKTQLLLTPPSVIKTLNEFNVIMEGDAILSRIEEKFFSEELDAYTRIAYILARKAIPREYECLDHVMAAFLANYAVKELAEDLKFGPLEYFVVNEVQSRAMEMDALAGSTAIKKDVGYLDYDDLSKDPITYSKGVSFIRSLMLLCGEEKFKKGIQTYIGSNVTDLTATWKSFQHCFVSESQASDFFTKWIDLPGYPVVHLKSQKGGTYRATQERFSWYGSQSGKKWLVPLVYKNSNGESNSIWLGNENDSVTVTGDWFTCNENYRALIRVNLDGSTWSALAGQLDKSHTKIDPITRGQLIDDLFSFPRSISNFSETTPTYATALNLINYLKNEKDFVPLKAAFRAFGFVDSALTDPLRKNFRNHLSSILQKLYQNFKLNSRGNSTSHVLLVQDIGSWACKLGIKECIDDAAAIFYSFILNRLDADFRVEALEPALCSAVRDNDDRWRMLSAALENETDRVFRKIYVQALGCARKEEIIERFLNGYIDKGDGNGLLEAVSSVMANPENVEFALKVINKEGKTINSLGVLDRIVEVAVPKVNQASAPNLLKIVNSYLPGKTELKRTVEKAKQESESWTKNKAATISQFFNTKNGAEGQVKPIALIVLLSFLFPFTKYLFNY